MVTVRDSTPALATAIATHLAGGTSSPDAEDPADATAIDELNRTPGSAISVAVREDVVLGFCQLMTVRHVQHRGERVAELESIPIADGERGRGVGTMLVAAARGLPCSVAYRLQLTPNAASADAHRLSERLGITASHLGFERAIAFIEPPAEMT